MVNAATRAKHSQAKIERAQANKGKTVIIDAAGHVLGRLSVHVAKRLLDGENVVVLNAEQALVTGSQKSIKARYQFKTTVGSTRKGPFPSRMPHLLFKRTVRGMLPFDRPNGRDAYKRLTCHIGRPAEFKSANAQTVEAAQRPVARGMSLLEVSRFLGKHVEATVSG